MNNIKRIKKLIGIMGDRNTKPLKMLAVKTEFAVRAFRLEIDNIERKLR